MHLLTLSLGLKAKNVVAIVLIYKIPIDERALGIAAVLLTLKVECVSEKWYLTYNCYAETRTKKDILNRKDHMRLGMN